MVPADIAARLGEIAPVSRETLDALDHLVAAVTKWSRSINLVAARGELWERHVLDSAQLYPLRNEGGATWCDLGTGGGFPGLVVATLGRADGVSFALVESDRRKAAFLSLMVRELGLNATVHAARAEALEPRQAATVSARALAPLPRLLALVHRHLAPSGVALLPKGRSHADEIIAARRHWGFTVDAVPSMLDPRSRVLRVTELRSSDAP